MNAIFLVKAILFFFSTVKALLVKLDSTCTAYLTTVEDNPNRTSVFMRSQI